MKDNAQPARWYMIDKDGMATLCVDREDAEKEAKNANMAWPHTAPHRAVQLVEVASVAASAGREPVIGWHAFPHYLQHPDGRLLRTASDLLARHGYTGCAEPLRAMSDVLLPTNPSPPEGMAGGWIASKDQMPPPGVRVFWGDVDSNRVGYDFWAGDDFYWAASHWMHIPEFPAPPTTAAGSGKGE